MRIVLLPLALLLSGCASIPKEHIKNSPVLYPNSAYWFTESTEFVVSELQPINERFDSRSPAGAKVVAVHFKCFDSISSVQAYYDSVCPMAGWKRLGHVESANRTIWGCDWVAVFKKDNMTVKICAGGMSKKTPNEKAETFVAFYFYKMRPETVLGENYQTQKPIGP